MLTLIQGNGEQFALECANCSLGYSPPTGTVKRTIDQFLPTRFTPTCVVRLEGNEVWYTDSEEGATIFRSVSSAELFPSHDACQHRCDELAAEKSKADNECAIANLASRRRKLAFSVHYWRRKVLDLERDLQTAKARLSVCKKDPQDPW